MRLTLYRLKSQVERGDLLTHAQSRRDELFSMAFRANHDAIITDQIMIINFTLEPRKKGMRKARLFLCLSVLDSAMKGVNIFTKTLAIA